MKEFYRKVFKIEKLPNNDTLTIETNIPTDYLLKDLMNVGIITKDNITFLSLPLLVNDENKIDVLVKHKNNMYVIEITTYKDYTDYSGMIKLDYFKI